MTRDEARSILKRHRPETRDAEDPDVAEALRLAQSDAELGQWLTGYQRSQQSIHRAFTSIRPPAGFREQILAEQPPTHRPRVIPWSRIAAGAVLLAMVGLGALWFSQSQRTPFDRFSTRMVKTALRTYAMDLETDDAAQAQTFLANAGAPADYVLPQGLSQATFVGCSALSFDGRSVTLLCFWTGKPLPPGTQSDLWLFVVGTEAVAGAPVVDTPEVQRRGLASVATWSAAGRTYLLVTSGTASDLKPLL